MIIMDLKEFIEEATMKIAGDVTKPYIQRKRKNKKYYDIPINEQLVKALNLSNGDLINSLIRKQNGKTVQVKRKVSKASNNRLKFYLPRTETEELELKEDDLLDIFLTKAE